MRMGEVGLRCSLRLSLNLVFPPRRGAAGLSSSLQYFFSPPSTVYSIVQYRGSGEVVPGVHIEEDWYYSAARLVYTQPRSGDWERIELCPSDGLTGHTRQIYSAIYHFCLDHLSRLIRARHNPHYRSRGRSCFCDCEYVSLKTESFHSLCVVFILSPISLSGLLSPYSKQLWTRCPSMRIKLTASQSTSIVRIAITAFVAVTTICPYLNLSIPHPQPVQNFSTTPFYRQSP